MICRNKELCILLCLEQSLHNVSVTVDEPLRIWHLKFSVKKIKDDNTPNNNRSSSSSSSSNNNPYDKNIMYSSTKQNSATFASGQSTAVT